MLLDDDGVKPVCVVTDENDGILEIKNIAVEPESQKKGYGTQLIRFLREKYRDSYGILQVGTGDSPLTVPFYESCEFPKDTPASRILPRSLRSSLYECESSSQIWFICR